jgi:hypothetical protein
MSHRQETNLGKKASRRSLQCRSFHGPRTPEGNARTGRGMNYQTDPLWTPNRTKRNYLRPLATDRIPPQGTHFHAHTGAEPAQGDHISNALSGETPPMD